MIKIINPGFFTTVQDEGRWGYQAYGMPVAGAMDRYAYRVANLLVGNKTSAAAIEMTVLGATFKFEETCLVAACGANMQVKVNGTPVNNWSAFIVNAGSEVKFEYGLSGCRAYLAVRGGIDVPPVLDSRSTYTRAKVGGFEGRTLQPGDILTAAKDTDFEAQPRTLDAKYIPQYSEQIDLKVMLGPQDDMFTPEALNTFLNSTYTMTEDADRMGCRLEGEKIAHAGKADIVSDALALGSIQVPAHGMPIIMVADRQTTGGYPKIATVVSTELWKLAQAKPGDKIRFVQVNDPEALEALKQERQTYADIVEYLKKPLPQGPSKQLKVTINGNVYDINITEVLD